MGSEIEKVLLLLTQQRFEQAESQIRTLLSTSPDDAGLYGLLADALRGQNRAGEALLVAQRARELCPESPENSYRMAAAEFELGRFDRALNMIDEAIKHGPNDPDLHQLRAMILLAMNRNSEAQEAAEFGLTIDAQHDGCLTARAAAMKDQGFTSSAREQLLAQLPASPNNEIVHCKLGETYLVEGTADLATRHFLEALRIDPNYEAARLGLIESYKARNSSYALLLKFGHWLGTLPSWVTWGGMLAVLALPRAVKQLAGDELIFRVLADFASLLIVVVSPLALCADAFFLLTLRLDKNARRILTDQQRKISNWQTLSLAAFALVLFAWPILGRLSLLVGTCTFANLTTHIPYAFVPLRSQSRRKVTAALVLSTFSGVIGMILAWPVTILIFIVLLPIAPKHVLYAALVFLVACYLCFQWIENWSTRLAQRDQLEGAIG